MFNMINIINFKIKINVVLLQKNFANYIINKCSSSAYITSNFQKISKKMQQQLRRIKNKDLSSLDERLFGNLDKVQTINSTLQNLQHFQQFLLFQIGKFQDEAKSKNKKKEVNQVIQQNCSTLRQSILKVVPDLQSSRARFKQQVLLSKNEVLQKQKEQSWKRNSQFNYRNDQLNYTKKGLNKQIDNKQPKFYPKQSSSITNQKSIILIKQSIQQFRNQIRLMKIYCQKIKPQIKNTKQTLFSQFTNIVQEKLMAIVKQKCKLKGFNQALLLEVSKLREQNTNLIQQNLTLKNKFNKNQQQKQQQLESYSILHKKNPHQSHNQAKSTQIRQKTAYLLQIKQDKQIKSQFESFADKIKLDFTGKFSKYLQAQQKISQMSKISDRFYQDPSTFRQSNTLYFENSYNDQNSRNIYRSIQLTNNLCNQINPDVPKLLRKNSLVNHYKSYNTQQMPKNRIPLQNTNTNVKSVYQSIQKNSRQSVSTCGLYQSSQKKSNHNLMRKTKSNFFKKQPNKQNIQVERHLPFSIYQTNMAKMKGLTNENSHTKISNKQKLKIFSMI